MNKIWRKEKITTLTKNESQPYSTSDANWFWPFFVVFLPFLLWKIEFFEDFFYVFMV
jgi:hypothetical protein